MTSTAEARRRVSRLEVERLERDVLHFEQVVLAVIAEVAPEVRERIVAALERAGVREGWTKHA